MKNTSLKLSITLAALAIAAGAQAAGPVSSTTGGVVSLTMMPVCSAVAISNLPIGTVSQGANAAVDGTVTATCGNGVPYSLTYAGTHTANATSGSFAMAMGTTTGTGPSATTTYTYLPYSLTDGSTTGTTSACGTGGTAVTANTAITGRHVSGSSATSTGLGDTGSKICASVASADTYTALPGAYSDTVTVTLGY